MPRQVVHHLAAPGGMSNMDGIFQIEMRRDSRQVIGIMVHIVALGALRRAAVPTPVMRNHPIATMQEEQHLVIPVVRAKRPTMTENYRLSFSPVLVINLDSIFSRNSGHETFSSPTTLPHRGNQYVPRRGAQQIPHPGYAITLTARLAQLPSRRRTRTS